VQYCTWVWTLLCFFCLFVCLWGTHVDRWIWILAEATPFFRTTVLPCALWEKTLCIDFCVDLCVDFRSWSWASQKLRRKFRTWVWRTYCVWAWHFISRTLNFHFILKSYLAGFDPTTHISSLLGGRRRWYPCLGRPRQHAATGQFFKSGFHVIEKLAPSKRWCLDQFAPWA
jgi:hypothetical protein